MRITGWIILLLAFSSAEAVQRKQQSPEMTLGTDRSVFMAYNHDLDCRPTPGAAQEVLCVKEASYDGFPTLTGLSFTDDKLVAVWFGQMPQQACRVIRNELKVKYGEPIKEMTEPYLGAATGQGTLRATIWKTTEQSVAVTQEYTGASAKCELLLQTRKYNEAVMAVSAKQAAAAEAASVSSGETAKE